jgi:hypothetical protein
MEGTVSMAEENNQILAHWQYDPGDWATFLDKDWERSRPPIIRGYIVLALLFLMFLAIVFVTSIRSAGWFGATLGVLWLGIPGEGFLLVCFLATYNSKQGWYDRVKKLRPAVTITPTVVIFGGEDEQTVDSPLTGFAQSLRVSIEPGDQPILLFDIIKHANRGARTEIRLLIPPGHESDARSIVDYFSWESTVARKALSS